MNVAISVAVLLVVIVVVPRDDHTFYGTSLLTDQPTGTATTTRPR